MRPPKRTRSRFALTLAEREEISRGVVADQSIRAIAGKVGKTNDAVKISLRRSRAALADGVPELSVVLENISQSARDADSRMGLIEI